MAGFDIATPVVSVRDTVAKMASRLFELKEPEGRKSEDCAYSRLSSCWCCERHALIGQVDGPLLFSSQRTAEFIIGGRKIRPKRGLLATKN